jgi:hypothetical protein
MGLRSTITLVTPSCSSSSSVVRSLGATVIVEVTGYLDNNFAVIVPNVGRKRRLDGHLLFHHGCQPSALQRWLRLNQGLSYPSSWVALVIEDADEPYHYAEIRGAASSSTGSDARRTIDELSDKYTGEHYPRDQITDTRAMLRISPKRQRIYG